MKTYWIKSLAAWLMLGAIFAACTKDEIIDEPQQGEAENVVHFTATLAPKDGSTRAITSSTDGDGKEILNVAWAEGEKIAVYYQTGTNPVSYATATATVTGVVDGVATIEADLSGAIDGSTVKFVYPYWLAKDGEIDESKLLNEQNGLLETISKNFDAATGTGIISVSPDETATINGNVGMKNEVCICKITLFFADENGYVNSSKEAGTTLYINVDDGRTYTISSPFENEVAIGSQNLYRPFKSDDVIYVAMLPATSQPLTFFSIDRNGKMYITSVTGSLEAGKFYRNVPITLNTSYTVTKTLTASTGELTLQRGDVLTGTGGANTRLKIEEGATVVLNGVTNTAITKEESIPGIECLGNATIILVGTNSVTGRENAAGIFVPEGKTLTILGSGSLHATGGNTSSTALGYGLIGGAGIGGTEGTSCGSIIIQGGTVSATGTGWCAGIGSGSAFDANITCGDITISGGTVTATGGVRAAGIGSGHANNASNTCGDITISGGTVTATGGKYAAGIGSGNGNNYNDGISSTLYPSSCGAISITGGTVTATSGAAAAGIGSGSDGKFTSISIGSGINRVAATRSNDDSNVPIGKGNDDQGSGVVTIDGQTLTDAQTGGTEALPTFTKLRVEKIDDTSFTNKTWTITKK